MGRVRSAGRLTKPSGMAGAFEWARRNPVTGLLACVAGFAFVLVLAYWVGPTERLDRSMLDAVSTRPDTFINEISYVGFQIVNFRPAWVLAGAVAGLVAPAPLAIPGAGFPP